ncbi:MAG TPA: hypothetical protein VKD91_18225 [Pyrinomonadaceae bacterium]|nr:hypothetical protein [Pyrinomonadaceae bacterium]
MGFVSDTIRKIAFWNYPRTSWQWDVLCVLILVFIFLTPKSWFANTAVVKPVVVPVELVGAQADKAEIERRARQVAMRPNGQVIAIKPVVEGGKLTGYEVDIR